MLFLEDSGFKFSVDSGSQGGGLVAESVPIFRRQSVLLCVELKLKLVDSLQRLAQVLVFLQGFASATGLINWAHLDLGDSLANPIFVH